MIKLKDLLSEELKLASQLGVKLTMMIQDFIVQDIEYTQQNLDVGQEKVRDPFGHWAIREKNSYEEWNKRYNYNDVKKFEKKYMKEIYKHLKKEGIKPNNPFVKLHSKILHSKVFSKSGIINKQLTNKAAGSPYEDNRWKNLKIIQDKMFEEVKDFYDNIIVLGK